MIYVNASADSKMVGIRCALQAQAWDKNRVALFDLLGDDTIDTIILEQDYVSDTELEYAKHEFDNVKFVVINPDELPYMADESTYGNGNTDVQFTTDIAVITDDLDDEDKYLYRWINGLGEKYNIKVYGTVRVPSVYYLGRPNVEDYKDIFRSAKAVIVFNDRWVYNIVLNDSIPLLFNPQADKEWEFKDFKDLCEKCTMYLGQYPSFMINLRGKAAENTYTHLAKELLI